MTDEDGHANYETFLECFAGPVIEKSRGLESKPKRQQRQRKGRKHGTDVEGTTTGDNHEDHATNDAAELADFVDYLAAEAFACLPLNLRTLSYPIFRSSPSVREAFSLPLSRETSNALLRDASPDLIDTLVSYGLITDRTSLSNFLEPILSAYVAALTTPPPPYAFAGRRASACEICFRDWIPLTYHHLIPRAVHAKVLKRGWHERWQLNAVAWLCRACHSFVHGIAGNEELARQWWTVEKLRERDDVKRWAEWVGRVRWKAA
ncbi:MAG: hypothetical protein M1837_002864 [Sclerophora amabilis]|nr:MAG: hypothetical protein M1837_002864 [Sclerophora amabilis]